MAPQQPLLAEDAGSENDDVQASAEDALLSGQHFERSGYGTNKKHGWAFWREIGLFVWALVATAAVIILAVVYQHQTSKANSGERAHPTGKRNLIFMVSDGMGPTSLSMTRSFRQFESGLPPSDVLVLDRHLIGSSRTRSSNSLVTDSAAGATAFSCGIKSYNGAISILDDQSPCGTVLEAAKKAGYMTGLVVTTRITDATPACFAAHVSTRAQEDRIAEQEVGYYPLGRVVDLMLGGGRCHFLPNSTAGSCRNDEKDVVAMAKDHGFSYVSDRAGFDGLKGGDAAKLPLLGLFAETDIPYEIDRRQQNDVYPSLDEMAKTALQALTLATKDSDKGFFLMIEGSRIDHAGHHNDPAAQVHEVLAYDKAFSSVLEYLEHSDVEGVVVSTSDHETGGLAAARQLYEASYPAYLWIPQVLSNASSSSESLAKQLSSFKGSTEEKKSFIQIELLQKQFGITDPSDAEIQKLLDHPDFTSQPIFSDMISRRAQVGWSTHGHSAVDVNIYGVSGTGALAGNHENTEVGEFLARYLDVDVKAVTEELKSKGVMYDQANAAHGESWRGETLAEGAVLDMCDGYHGEFKHKHKH